MLETNKYLRSRPSLSRTASALGCALLTMAVSGCGGPVAEFSPNLIHIRFWEGETGEYSDEQEKDIVNATSALFGEPDKPFMPPVEGLDEVLEMRRVRLAAGPVQSDEDGQDTGLYRQHCVHCHGISGNGKGPTAAFLNPYPRDFSMGKFKFSSTPVGYKPTTDDLHRILRNGIAGTAMPSFDLLSEGEIDSLVDYVKYLSIRGETERRLIAENPDFYDPDDPEMRKAFLAKDYLVDEVLSSVVQSWITAESSATHVPQRPEQYDRLSDEFDAAALQASVDRGRKLYYSNDAQCVKCHGPSQLGDGQTNDYDEWSKDFFDWQKKESEAYPDKMAEYLELGGLKPRNIIPRNLRSGVYRGGRRPVDIYWRIHNGIEGSGMPESNKAALNDEDLWDLVNYVLSLPYEPLSRPGVDVPVNVKEVK